MGKQIGQLIKCSTCSTLSTRQTTRCLKRQDAACSLCKLGDSLGLLQAGSREITESSRQKDRIHGQSGGLSGSQTHCHLESSIWNVQRNYVQLLTDWWMVSAHTYWAGSRNKHLSQISNCSQWNTPWKLIIDLQMAPHPPTPAPATDCLTLHIASPLSMLRSLANSFPSVWPHFPVK